MCVHAGWRADYSPRLAAPRAAPPAAAAAAAAAAAQCYYIGPIKRELSQPIKNGVPTEKICERLKKSSAEICSLRFATAAPLPAAASIEDFSKLRVKDLKQIMAEKGIKCPDCLEKDDFVKKLEELKGKGEL